MSTGTSSGSGSTGTYIPPTPSAGTGFDNFLASGSTSGSTSSSFPSQQVATSFPGVSSKQMMLIVPGSGTPAQTPFPFAPGEQRRMDIQEGGTPDQSLAALMANLAAQSQANPDAIAHLQDKLILAGLLDPRSRSYTPGGIVQPGDATWTAYRNLLLDAVRQKESYLDLLDAKVKSGAGEKKFNLSQSYQSIAVTNPQDARLTLTRVMSSELGRRPTNAEIADYTQRLASQAYGSPTTTTVNHDINAYLNKNDALGVNDYQNQVGTTTTTSGGINPEVVAENQIYNQNGQELAQTRATDIYALFQRMLSGEGSLV